MQEIKAYKAKDGTIFEDALECWKHNTKNELREHITNLIKNYPEADIKGDCIAVPYRVEQILTIIQDNEKLLTLLLQLSFKTAPRTECSSRLEALEHKLSEQKHQITIQQEALHKKNLELDALHHVWCSGGCDTGVHRYTNETLTDEIVEQAQKSVARLVEYWNNYKAKK
jgi:HAMP domain-containing protein